MAGNRQHFIPQFLLKGFASRKARSNLFCWVYRKNIKPFETNITKIGVERKFYVESEDTTLDESITGAEAEYS